MVDSLAKRLRNKDPEAYEEFLESIEQPMINFIYRYVGNLNTAEDLFQETFVRFLRSIDRFEPTASLKTYIFTIARNLCLDHLKARKNRVDDPALEDDEGQVIKMTELLMTYDNPSKTVEEKELQERVLSKLQKIPEINRDALILRLYNGFSYEEIAEITEVPVGTCKFRVHSAIESLRELMGEKRNLEKGAL